MSSRPPYSSLSRFRSPLTQRLQSLRYRRERQEAERAEAEEERVQREREQLILGRLFRQPTS